jgi:ABC-type transport system involved in cytochrome bd biosynthesis fused ATPase/permease subunit
MSLALITGIGAADHAVRLAFARFAFRTIDDLRTAAFDAAVANRGRSGGAGDLIARLVADAARAKAGLKSFLVHVVCNALLFVGVAFALAAMNVIVGLIMALSCAVVAAYTTCCAARIYRRTARTRSREGRLADRIQSAVDGSADSTDARSLERRLSKASATAVQGRAISDDPSACSTSADGR